MNKPIALPFLATPTADMAIPAMCFIGPAVIILLVAVILIETIALNFTDFKPFKKSMRIITVINLASTMIGIPIFSTFPRLDIRNPLHFILLFVLTIAVEFPIFYWMTQDLSWGSLKRVSLVNAVSYGLLAILVFGFVEPWPRCPENFPEADIVFECNLPDDPGLCFVNADGSKLVRTATETHMHVPHVVGNLLIFSFGGYDPRLWYDPFEVGGYASVIGICRANKVTSVCKVGSDIDYYYPLQDGETLILIFDFFHELRFLNMPSCRTSEPITMSEDFDHELFTSASTNYDRTLLVFSTYRNQIGNHMYALEIETGTLHTLEEGQLPRISPDGAQIAFSRDDGVYLMDINGENVRRILDIPTDESGWSIYRPLPAVEWSPDGNELVYARCLPPDNGPILTTDCEIFLYNLEAEKETLLVPYGAYPSWVQ